MAKVQSLDTSDLVVSTPARRTKTPTVTKPKAPAHVPSSELIPLQFKMTPEFVREFKIIAATDGYKLNELLKECFDAFKKARKK